MKVIVEADGGSRGNPGPAGYGSVVRTADRAAVLAESKQAIGRATNNVAEYRGLIAGLEEAAKLGATEVDVAMDSKLVVEQMSGRWKVKNPDIAALHQQATALSARFERITYTWIPRAKNSHADRLANEAMDTQARINRKPAESSSPSRWTGATGSPTRLLMLRHGQTDFSAQGRYSGRADLPLTELGERQAAAAAARLAGTGDVAAVVSSPMLRAKQTAQPVAGALGLPLRIHDGLIEADFGTWEGLTFAEANARDPELHTRWLTDTSVAPPGGESMDAVHRRARRVRDQLIAEHGGATVVVVSHVTPIKSLLRMALDAGPSLLHRLHLDIASLSVAEFYPDGPAIVRLVNDTSYLP
jgi:broad specificity phosphatase PhoE/ribonuclease HI